MCIETFFFVKVCKWGGVIFFQKSSYLATNRDQLLLFNLFSRSPNEQNSDSVASSSRVETARAKADIIRALMEEEGIYYYFKQEETGHKMVVANTPQSHHDHFARVL